jgi:Saxitoxin biosynthesis operon protein SxtJ
MDNSLRLPSDRSFGWTFAGIFALIGLLHPWAFGLAALTAAVTYLHPEWLAPLKRAWMKLGELLHHVVSPVVLGIMFFGVFTPVGWMMRLAGRDAMARSFDGAAETYWVKRDPPGPAEDSFGDLF